MEILFSFEYKKFAAPLLGVENRKLANRIQLSSLALMPLLTAFGINFVKKKILDRCNYEGQGLS